MDGGLSMSDVVLRASGYTWKGPECGRCNYTGPAPEQVRCKARNGEFGSEASITDGLEVKAVVERR